MLRVEGREIKLRPKGSNYKTRNIMKDSEKGINARFTMSFECSKRLTKKEFEELSHWIIKILEKGCKVWGK